MALPVPPVNPNDQIPNNPFYYPETAFLYGPTGPLVVGSGFSINNATGTISASGGGSGAPTILAGAGIAVTSGVGTVTVTNTGILTVTAGAGIAVTGSGGNLQITNTAPAPLTFGTVTSVGTGTGLTGGPISGSGTISLAPVGTISPGTYLNATITVDAYGRVTAASPGAGGLGSLLQATAPLSVNASIPQTISINNASTSAPGAVQLNTSTSSISTTQAATPSAVKTAFDTATTASTNASTALSTATTAATTASSAQTAANAAQTTATSAQAAANAAQTTANTALANAATAQAKANAAIPCSAFTVKGQLLAATGSGTFNALLPGLNGQVLVACSSCTAGVTWLSQPFGTGTVTSVNTGFGLTGGPITTTGTIALAPTSVVAGSYTFANFTVDVYGRITSAGNGAPPISCSAITAKGAILTGTAAGIPVALPVGSDGRVLTACAACPTGLTWVASSSAGIPCACITAKGALVTGTAANTPVPLPVGLDNYVLTADSACATGLKWAVAASPTTPATPTAEGVIYGYSDNATNFATALGYDALNTTVTGPGNVAIGTSAGCSLTSGQLNTYVGSGAGCANTIGCNNIALGAQALFAHVSGDCNIVIGNLGGLNLTTECGNVILGPYQGEAGCDNNVYIADGTGMLRLRLNENGAFSVGGSGYGTAGQVLTSGGIGGNPTWTTVASSGGTVTSISLGVGLCGPSNPITTTGTIALCNTTVTAGSYTNACITVDTQGRLTAAGSGIAPLTALTGTAPIDVTAGTTPVVSICSASTTTPGAVQLYNNTDSTSTTLALTAAQGKNLQDQITALSVSGTVELAGTIDAGAGGIMFSVTSVGTADGYVVGNTLPAADATTNNTYVIVTNPGTVTPPGGVATAATRGDWFLVSETSPGVYAWTFLNVGFDVSYATTASSGVVCLSTNALAQAGVDTLTALTPAAAASAYIPKTCITAKGTLITGTAANTPTALAVGTDGQYLLANSACPSGIQWQTGMGDTPVGTINWFSAQTAPNGWLVADGRAVSRTLYADLFAKVGTTYGAGDGSTTFNLPDLRGMFARGWDAAGGTARGCDTGRVFGSTQQDAIQCHQHVIPWGEYLTSCFGQTTQNIYRGVATVQDFDNRWYYSNDGTNFDGVLNPAGVIGCETRPMNVALLPCIKWQVTTAPSSCGIPCACITAKGTIITGDAPTNPVALPVGTDGQALVACGACPTGLTWATPAVPVSAATPTAAGIVLGCTTASNTALGSNALTSVTSGIWNATIGLNALCNATSGSCNVSVGVNAGICITTGCQNVAIGPFVQVASPTGSCQLAIGYAVGCNWLTGDSNKNIQPGASIKDCTGSVGTVDQVLCSNGTNLQWANVGALPPGRVVSGIVNAGVEICMDNFAFSMASGGCRSFGFRTLSGTAFVTWSNCGNQYGYTTANTFANFTITTAFQRFDNGYNYSAHGANQQATLCVGSPPTAAYQVLGIVGSFYANNIICVTRIV